MEDGVKLAPSWVMVLVCCGLLSYVVVNRQDDSDVKGAGCGIACRVKASPGKLPLAEQRERSRQVVNQVESAVRRAPAQMAPAADLGGTWVTFDKATRWTISPRNGVFVFREQPLAVPDVVTAAGYGALDGRTWSVQFESILGISGTAALELQDDGTLRGQATPVIGISFPLALRRE
jgi:hypothetical protein